jgi:hypothetical protein
LLAPFARRAVRGSWAREEPPGRRTTLVFCRNSPDTRVPDAEEGPGRGRTPLTGGGGATGEEATLDASAPAIGVSSVYVPVSAMVALLARLRPGRVADDRNDRGGRVPLTVGGAGDV